MNLINEQIGGLPSNSEVDLIGEAYKKGDYATANRLIGEQKLSAQDVVNKYNLNASQSSEVAKNLGYTGDLNPLKLQYGTGYVAPPPPPVYKQYTDQDIVSGLQSLATQNLRSGLTPDPSETAEQLKAAIKTYNPDPAQVNRILNSGIVVPITGSNRFGEKGVNLNTFADDFAMATSKTPFIDANGKLTLDPKASVQAAQNELDKLFDPNKGSLMPIKNADFESGGKYYGQVGNRDKMIADWYNDPANKATIDTAQKTVFDKFGVPTDMRLAPRAISSMLAKSEVKPASSAYVDPINYTSYNDYINATNAASLKAFQDELDIYKKYGIDRMQNDQPRVPNSDQIKMANLRAGLGGRDETSEANFYGMTLENFNKAKSGRENNYFNTLRTPIERLAEETARAQGIGTMSPQTAALAKKYPDIFNKASEEWRNYLTTTFPQTLEYESVLSGPMKFSSTGVEYPKIDNTASMYSLNPVTKQISNNPNYQPTTSEKIARMYILDPKTRRYIRNPAYKAPVKKASGGKIKISNNPADMFLEMVENIPKRK
jgi:hypothetical protein